MISKKTKIILASKSPRRKEILEKAGYSFDIIPSSFEMNINGKTYSDNLLLQCVIGKIANLNLYNTYDDLLIISADTVVVFDNIIFGKPKDETVAFNILKKLSGNTHFVATGIDLTYTNNGLTTSISDIEKTYVTFKNLTNEEISEYIKSANPFDKAGAYGIQDPSFHFAAKIDGNLDNVIGFPMTLFKNLLKQLSR